MNQNFYILYILQDAIAKEKSWLQDVKDQKGNTEANSLKKAKDINDHGIYEFELQQSAFNRSEISMGSIIRLKLDTKRYSYDELMDLHDKLILVVGRKSEDKKIIDDFEQV